MTAKFLAWATAGMELLPIEMGKTRSGANSVVSVCVWMWDVRERKELRLTPKLLAGAPARIGLLPIGC